MDVDIKKVDKSQLKSFLSFDLLLLPKLVKLGFITAAAFLVLMAVLAPFYMAGAFMGFFSLGGFLHGLVTAVFLIAVGLPWLRIAAETCLLIYEMHGVQVPKRPVYAAPTPPAPAPSEPPKADAAPSPAPPPFPPTPSEPPKS